jgi:hypothetical protein
VRVERYDGDRDPLRRLFAPAEDSADRLDTYINDGRVLAAWDGLDLVRQRVEAGGAEPSLLRAGRVRL